MSKLHLISIVGAGPGDPELLTVKALRRLKEADVLLYDALMGDEILNFTREDAVKTYVGKLYADGQDQTERQDAIHEAFLYWASQNKKVVRLKAGDPMIYGRGAEEVRFCKTHKLNYEVIPGITAGIAASSLFSVPLTERGKNNMLLFYTGRPANNGFPDVKTMLGVLENGSPVLVYMGLNNLPALADELIGSGVSGSTPVQILSRVSQEDQQQYSTTLNALEGYLKDQQPETPSVIIIGKYAETIL